MAEIRQTREPREQDVRENIARPAQWAPASALPEVNKQQGWAYRWIRSSMVGQSDAMNVSSKMREGWEPVRMADHPELKLYSTNTDSRFKDAVEVGGLILCKIPEEFVSQRNAYYNKQTQNQSEAVENNFMKENDQRMPLFKERRSNTSFGRGN